VLKLGRRAGPGDVDRRPSPRGPGARIAGHPRAFDANLGALGAASGHGYSIDEGISDTRHEPRNYPSTTERVLDPLPDWAGVVELLP